MLKNCEAYKNCKECADVNLFPYKFCCIKECGEHEFCRGCNKGIYLNGGKK